MEGVWKFGITMIVTNQTFKTDKCSFLPLSPRDSDGTPSIQFNYTQRWSFSLSMVVFSGWRMNVRWNHQVHWILESEKGIFVIS
jgi:hypothetical protein